MGYTGHAIAGGSWVGLLRVATRLLGIVRIAILARILTPAQFGIFGIASILLAFIEIITETGINVFLVQEEKKIEEYISTAWIVSIVRGTLIAAVILLFSPLIVNFFHAPEAFTLILFISLVPFIRGFINPAVAALQKELLFDKEFRFRLAIFFVDAFVAVLATFITRSPIGIIWGLIAGAVVEVLLSFFVIKPHPTFSFESAKIRHILARGKWVTASGIFSYAFHNGSDVVIGRLLSSSALGLYQVGYKISTLTITEVGDIVSRVVFPVFVKISGDTKRLRRAFLKTFLVMCLITLPFGLVLFFFPETIITILLGKQWLAAVPVVKVLALFGIVRAISGTCTPLFLAVKKQNYAMMVMFVSLCFFGAFIIPFVIRFGIIGASYALFIGAVASLPISAYYCFRILRV